MEAGCWLLFGLMTAAQTDQDKARALIDKAIQAQGGLERLGKNVGVHGRFKGVHWEARPLADADWFRGEYYSQGPAKLRLILDFKADNRRILIYNQGKAWMQYDGFTQELDEDFVKRLTRANHVDRVAGLITLVRNKGFTFTLLGESMVEKTAVVGVKVSAEAQPDVSLYFDKATGLLKKSAHRASEFEGDKEVLHEVVYEDYRLLDVAAADDKLLADAGRKTTGPELLAALRAATPDAAARNAIQDLIAQLGAKSFAARQQATKGLIKHGIRAAALLQQARKVADVEVARRAENCLERLGKEFTLLAATVRLVAARKPAGAAQGLLDYLPSAPSEAVVAEVQDALIAIAQASKKPDAALVQALKASDPQVRQAAEAALSKDGGPLFNRPGRRLYLEGVRLPSRSITYQSGEKRMLLETFDREYFNRFDDALFAPPDQDQTPR